MHVNLAICLGGTLTLLILGAILVILSIPIESKGMCGHGCPHKLARAMDGAC